MGSWWLSVTDHSQGVRGVDGVAGDAEVDSQLLDLGVVYRELGFTLATDDDLIG